MLKIINIILFIYIIYNIELEKVRDWSSEYIFTTSVGNNKISIILFPFHSFNISSLSLSLQKQLNKIIIQCFSHYSQNFIQTQTPFNNETKYQVQKEIIQVFFLDLLAIYIYRL